MGAQHFTFASKFSQNRGFFSPKVCILDEHFPTRRYFDNFSAAENLRWASVLPHYLPLFTMLLLMNRIKSEFFRIESDLLSAESPTSTVEVSSESCLALPPQQTPPN